MPATENTRYNVSYVLQLLCLAVKYGNDLYDIMCDASALIRIAVRPSQEHYRGIIVLAKLGTDRCMGFWLAK